MQSKKKLYSINKISVFQLIVIEGFLVDSRKKRIEDNIIEKTPANPQHHFVS